MPNYYNPYNFYPVSYANQMGYSGMPQQAQMPMQQSFAQQGASQGPKIMEWVEGEVGAKAYQMPNGWPANSPIPLWDSTDTVIWLKSWGPMGIPNPMQKLRYEMPEQQNQALLTAGNSGSTNAGGNNNQQDMSQYVTKQDLENIRKEMMNALSTASNNNNGGNNNSGNYSGNNQNGNNNAGQNRGGNR